MKLTHCPVDHSPIRRARDGEITCGGPLVGGHSEAHMIEFLRKKYAAPAPPPDVAHYGELCPRCAHPRLLVVEIKKTSKRYALCETCRSLQRPTKSQFTLAGPPAAVYYYEGRTTR